MSPVQRLRPRSQHARDQHESELTALLRELWDADPTVLAAAFVDWEGETIDYFSSIDPFQTKLYAAQLVAWAGQLSSTDRKLAVGPLCTLELLATKRELLLRRVDEDYALTVVRHAHPERRDLLRAMERSIAGFRQRVSLRVPEWEPPAPRLHVELRSAVGWPYAPCAFSVGGSRTVITEVLGRWRDTAGGEPCVSFRVRTERGEELTLEHHRERWLLVASDLKPGRG